MWFKRTDARVSTSTDGTVRLAGQHAGETCLRSKQELLRRERLWSALTVEGVNVRRCDKATGNWGRGLDKQAVCPIASGQRAFWLYSWRLQPSGSLTVRCVRIRYADCYAISSLSELGNLYKIHGVLAAPLYMQILTLADQKLTWIHSI